MKQENCSAATEPLRALCSVVVTARPEELVGLACTYRLSICIVLHQLSADEEHPDNCQTLPDCSVAESDDADCTTVARRSAS
jgi:hypothetical protein